MVKFKIYNYYNIMRVKNILENVNWICIGGLMCKYICCFIVKIKWFKCSFWVKCGDRK